MKPLLVLASARPEICEQRWRQIADLAGGKPIHVLANQTANGHLSSLPGVERVYVFPDGRRMTPDLWKNPEIELPKSVSFSEAVFIVGSGGIEEYAGVFDLSRLLAGRVYAMEADSVRKVTRLAIRWRRLKKSVYSALEMKNWSESLHRIRWRMAKRMVPRRHVRSRGLEFTLQCENWITHGRWKTYNTKEPETLDWIDRHLKKGDVFFDIGANIGVYTIYAALRCPAARVISVEPEYANLHLLRDNILENALGDRVEIFSIALSDRSGLSGLHIHDMTPGSALHTESRTPLKTTRTRQRIEWREGIFAYSLDDFCAEMGARPNCIKIDIDGTEDKVLQGGMKTLAAPSLRTVMIEIARDTEIYAACERFLIGAGLRREWYDPLGKNANEVWVRG